MHKARPGIPDVMDYREGTVPEREALWDHQDLPERDEDTVDPQARQDYPGKMVTLVVVVVEELLHLELV